MANANAKARCPRGKRTRHRRTARGRRRHCEIRTLYISMFDLRSISFTSLAVGARDDRDHDRDAPRAPGASVRAVPEGHRRNPALPYETSAHNSPSRGIFITQHAKANGLGSKLGHKDSLPT